jgi:predicted DNA-binding transcriptional regulator AlpA
MVRRSPVPTWSQRLDSQTLASKATRSFGDAAETHYSQAIPIIYEPPSLTPRATASRPLAQHAAKVDRRRALDRGPHANRGSVVRPIAGAVSPVSSADRDSEDRETAIDSRATAPILGLSPVTLQQLRARGDGPPFFRIGRTVRYRLGDVIAWRDERTIGRWPS